MTCQAFVEFIVSYLEGGLSDEERRRFDEHLAVCPDCVRYLAQYRDTIKAGQLAFADELPASVPESLVQAILRARTQD